ncbi:sensor histidine kinase [Hallella multisaccharivorax]|uniref:sensor histidine kinase n=1 Tax=Hallella multisaccharivorax TaxID=310514 RepID=UPI003611C717
MQWSGRNSQIKFILTLSAIVVVVCSLFVSNRLTNDLKREERNRMEVWAAAMKSLNNADEYTDMSLVLKVLNENESIPVVLLDQNGTVTDFRNVRLHADNHRDSLSEVRQIALNGIASGHVIRVSLDADGRHYINVCYEESLILRRLTIFPYIQLAIVLIFVLLAVFALIASNRAEQNRVWVGLSKETAHQLGTPISSLMAWTEVLREEYPNDDLIPELDKDVRRLQLISERFSKIGSEPELKPARLSEVLAHVTDYISRRTSHSVSIISKLPECEETVNINEALFEWVIENLCKNAVDAMNGGPGTITIAVFQTPEEVVIEVSDTGKGISKQHLKSVFNPGFTTKKRGWGLGLSLAKRIVEQYHHGRIWVKSSVAGKGTTFRIELKK